MGTVPQVIVYIAPSKSEARTALWLPIDKSMERLTFATPSVEEFQEVASNSLDLRYVPDETNIDMTVF